MTYNGKKVNISILVNTDVNALAKSIRNVVQSILDIKYAVVQKEPFIFQYSAIVITEEA